MEMSRPSAERLLQGRPIKSVRMAAERRIFDPANSRGRGEPFVAARRHEGAGPDLCALLGAPRSRRTCSCRFSRLRRNESRPCWVAAERVGGVQAVVLRLTYRSRIRV